RSERRAANASQVWCGKPYGIADLQTWNDHGEVFDVLDPCRLQRVCRYGRNGDRHVLNAFRAPLCGYNYLAHLGRRSLGLRHGRNTDEKAEPRAGVTKMRRSHRYKLKPMPLPSLAQESTSTC